MRLARNVPGRALSGVTPTGALAVIAVDDVVVGAAGDTAFRNEHEVGHRAPVSTSRVNDEDSGVFHPVFFGLAVVAPGRTVFDLAGAALLNAWNASVGVDGGKVDPPGLVGVIVDGNTGRVETGGGGGVLGSLNVLDHLAVGRHRPRRLLNARHHALHRFEGSAHSGYERGHGVDDDLYGLLSDQGVVRVLVILGIERLDSENR